MTACLQLLILTVGGGAMLPEPAERPPAPTVLKVDPPSWWPGHTLNPVRLLVRGRNLQGANVVSPRLDVIPGEIRVNDRGTYLFVSIQIEPGAPPGDAPLKVEARGDGALVPFRLDPPLRSGATAGGRGIGPDDVIELIMIDRFADGDQSRNVPPGSPPAAAGRDKPRGFHGGDLGGIVDHLDYFRDLGVTALWLTPWYDNFNGLYECDKPWCPYTYYHGYHAIDHYAVEDHFGTLEQLRELVDQAHARGLKVIQDQISNHVGLRHPWVEDPPLPTWFHGTPARHIQNPFRSERLLSPHAPAVMRAEVLDGWFSPDSPDLNQDEPEVARYLIQNALWWLGAVGIDAIREDTAQYVPRWFLRDLCAAVHRQYSRATIVGEVLDLDPIHTSFFLGGRAGWDGIDTGLDSIFDFPGWWAVANATAGKSPMTAIRDALRADALYADPQRLTTLTGNHDLRRFPSWPGATADAARLQMALTLCLRGTPQFTYGDEMGMAGEGDPDNRRDFPGGFPGDVRSAFVASGRTPEEDRMWSWTRDWIALRKAHPALRRGELIDLDATPSVYVFARKSETETLVLAFNRDGQAAGSTFPAAAINARAGMRLVPLQPEAEPATFSGDTVTLRLPPHSAVAFELR
jgi:glycosidase